MVRCHPNRVVLNIPEGCFEVLMPENILQNLGVATLSGGVICGKAVAKGMGRTPPAAYARSPAKVAHHFVNALVGQGAALPQEDVG